MKRLILLFSFVCLGASSSGCVVFEMRDELRRTNQQLEHTNESLAQVNRSVDQINEVLADVKQKLASSDSSLASINESLEPIRVSLRRIDDHLAGFHETIEKIDRVVPGRIAPDRDSPVPQEPTQETTPQRP